MLARCLAGLVGMRYVLPLGVLVPEPGVRDEEPGPQEAAMLGVADEFWGGNACGVNGCAILGRPIQRECRLLHRISSKL